VFQRFAGFRGLSLAVATGFSVVLLWTASTACSQQKTERDIFDYEAHKAAKDCKRIVFVAGTEPHGARGNHEFLAAAIYLARTINAQYPNVYAAVHTMPKWPTDLKHADAVVVLLNHARTAINPAVKEAMDRKAGFMAIHYGVEVDKGEQGKEYMKWLGGYFETNWSVNPFWTPEFKDLPKHDVTRGVKPFTINDEWYYHMRFVDKMEGVTPILAAVPPLSTIKGAGQKSYAHEGNPDAYKDVQAGIKQVVAWAYERPGGGRGFGFSGLHKHSNLGDDNFRTLLLNAVAWITNLEIPAGGVASQPLSRQDLEALIDDGKLAIKKRGI
jgi:hypothetical protein